MILVRRLLRREFDLPRGAALAERKPSYYLNNNIILTVQCPVHIFSTVVTDIPKFVEMFCFPCKIESIQNGNHGLDGPCTSVKI